MRATSLNRLSTVLHRIVTPVNLLRIRNAVAINPTYPIIVKCAWSGRWRFADDNIIKWRPAISLATVEEMLRNYLPEYAKDPDFPHVTHSISPKEAKRLEGLY